MWYAEYFPPGCLENCKLERTDYPQFDTVEYTHNGVRRRFSNLEMVFALVNPVIEWVWDLHSGVLDGEYRVLDSEPLALPEPPKQLSE